MSEPISKREFDVIVIGAGGAGMTAALVAAIQGLDVLVIEKSSYVGGTTALSAGSIWLPNSQHAPTGSDSLENAQQFLQETVGNYSSAELKTTFLTHAPVLVKLLDEHSEVKLRAYPHHPDYLADAPGATLAGRVLEPLPFDGRLLGDSFSKLRSPLPEFTLFGGMMVDRNDIRHLLNLTRSPQSAWYVTKLLSRFGKDCLRHSRGTRLVMGNALVGRLFYSLLSRNVAVWTDCQVTQLNLEKQKINGVQIEINGERIELQTRRGVILSTGGFAHHPQLRQQLLPQPLAQYSVVPENIRGDGFELAKSAGGRLVEGHANNGFWAPVSVRQRADGSTAVFPHFVLDRGKPGLIAVNSAGKRFVNEATSYQLFSEGIYQSQQQTPTIPCFFICDRDFIPKYGLGMIRPRTRNVSRFIQQGYLIEASTIVELAKKLEIESAALEQTIERYNRFAQTGEDPDFNKGSNAYQQNLGDPNHRPNPCIGPITQAPFYAIRIYPGDIGSSCGLVTNANAQVLGDNDLPIKGLYACGNDMNSVMGGVYPGPGITLGPGMTFAYIAATHAAGKKN